MVVRLGSLGIPINVSDLGQGVRAITHPLTERLADIGGQLQRLRWEAQDEGLADTARDIAHAIDAVAWAAGIYSPGANIVDRPGTARPQREIPQKSYPAKKSDAA